MTSIDSSKGRTSGFCSESRPDNCGFTIFGASGDLTGRKLIPALFSLFKRNLLPDEFYILGVARTKMDDEAFREIHRRKLSQPGWDFDVKSLETFISRLYYISGDYGEKSLYESIDKKIGQFETDYKTPTNHIFYLSTPPGLYCPIIRKLKEEGLTRKENRDPLSLRVVIEKPFGRDLQSAESLNRSLQEQLKEEQIYRIDHYLGKETVQNILMMRFANAIFEPIWNRRYIDNIQITAAEDIGIEHRAGYYEEAGLLRDMFQNHMLQLLSLVAMEPPTSFDGERIRDEKIKLLRSIQPFPKESLNSRIVRGQYGAGITAGRRVPAYREEKGVSPESDTETFTAMKILIDNWRWQGVPFYMRSGKRLPEKSTRIVITFNRVPHSMFAARMPEDLHRNLLILNVQPDEGMALTIQAKQPGAKMCMSPLTLDFSYRNTFGAAIPDAYERLLLDVMLKDQSLFIRRDGMHHAWELLTPVLNRWKESPSSNPLHIYPAGTWGPIESQDLLAQDGRQWHNTTGGKNEKAD